MKSCTGQTAIRATSLDCQLEQTSGGLDPSVDPLHENRVERVIVTQFYLFFIFFKQGEKNAHSFSEAALQLWQAEDGREHVHQQRLLD